jgi:hypothetical protein
VEGGFILRAECTSRIIKFDSKQTKNKRRSSLPPRRWDGNSPFSVAQPGQMVRKTITRGPRNAVLFPTPLTMDALNSKQRQVGRLPLREELAV